MTPEVQRALEQMRRGDEQQARLTAEWQLKENARIAAGIEWKKNRPDLRTDVQVGMIAEDCSLHIGEVLECDPYEGNVRIKSMFDGVERSCDLYHCGVIVQTPEDIAKKTVLYNEGGMAALSKLYQESFE